jgi:hypothetical protein
MHSHPRPQAATGGTAGKHDDPTQSATGRPRKSSPPSVPGAGFSTIIVQSFFERFNTHRVLRTQHTRTQLSLSVRSDLDKATGEKRKEEHAARGGQKAFAGGPRAGWLASQPSAHRLARVTGSLSILQGPSPAPAKAAGPRAHAPPRGRSARTPADAGRTGSAAARPARLGRQPRVPLLPLRLPQAAGQASSSRTEDQNPPAVRCRAIARTQRSARPRTSGAGPRPACCCGALPKTDAAAGSEKCA